MPEDKIHVAIPGRAYDIVISQGALAAGSFAGASDIFAERACLIVTDSNVQPLYEQAARELLRRAGAAAVHCSVFPAGEPSKTLDTIAGFYHDAVEAGLDRSSLVVALGGGVTGDMAGFLAATYMRGIDYVQMPTSLLAQVDSAVGGKTGVDLPSGKNLVGAFKQPLAVFVELDSLQTLPARQLRCGLGEVVKYGVIQDEEFFRFLEGRTDALLALDTETYAHVIRRCCQLKADVVLADEEDRCGRRAILNYGHTFGHALEKLAGFRNLTHGEAVSIGMMMAAECAAIRAGDGRFVDLVERQRALLTALGLPVRAEGFTPDRILAAMRTDKKYEQGQIRVILPERLGSCVVVKDVTETDLLAAIEVCCDP